MNTFTWDEILKKNQTKADLFKPLQDAEQDFDFALPQQWLNYMVSGYNIDYEMVRFSTVWLYPQDRPFSMCAEVAKKISDYYYQEV